jgi:hypothetical protein
MTATNPTGAHTDFGSDRGHAAGAHSDSGRSHSASDHAADGRVAQRRSTETKASTKTTEFMVYLAAVAAVIITALVVGKDGSGADPFSALDAIRYISYLTIGYMIARGLAKSGSREDYFQDRDAQR